MRIIEAVVHQIEIKKNSKYERQTDNISIDNKIVKSPIKTNLPIILMHFLYMPLHIHILYWQRWTIKKKQQKASLNRQLLFRFVLKIYMLWYLCKFKKKKAISKALLLVNRQLLFRFVLKICCGNYVKVFKRVNNNHYILFTGGSRGQNSTENLIIHVYL